LGEDAGVQHDEPGETPRGRRRRHEARATPPRRRGTRAAPPGKRRRPAPEVGDAARPRAEAPRRRGSRGPPARVARGASRARPPRSAGVERRGGRARGPFVPGGSAASSEVVVHDLGDPERGATSSIAPSSTRREASRTRWTWRDPARSSVPGRLDGRGAERAVLPHPVSTTATTRGPKTARRRGGGHVRGRTNAVHGRVVAQRDAAVAASDR
jgi:hypothetical protein